MKRIGMFLVLIMCWYGVAEAAEEEFFQLTQYAFEQLAEEDMPQEVLDNLNALEDEEFSKENAFLQAVEDRIGKELTEQYKKPLLRVARKTQEKEGLAKRATKSVVKNTISFLKDVVSGVDDGIDEGRGAATSSDGAQVVTKEEELQKQGIEIMVLGVMAGHAENVTIVELGFKNPNDTPIRIANLRDEHVVQLIDKDGFATGLTNSLDNPANVTVPPNAAVRQAFQLHGDHANAQFLRIFTQDIELKTSKE